jgi:hypothetical protein
VFAHEHARSAVITDLGHVPKRLAQHLDGCQLVLLESNHDPELLRIGPYPDFLKKRVASRFGHLSNEQAASLIAELGPDTTEVVLVHLSRTNNSPLLALSAARAALRGRKMQLCTAHQDEPLDRIVKTDPSARRRPHEAQLALPLG